MRLSQMILIAFCFSQLGLGQIDSGRPANGKKKTKSLTTAQIYKRGPFRGAQTIAAIPSTVKAF